MGYDQLVAIIQTRCGFHDKLADVIAAEVQLAQYELEHDVTFNPWFLWRAADVCVDETCLNITLPVGFLRLCEFNNPLFQKQGCHQAYPLNRGFADDVYAHNMPAGVPYAFTLQAGFIRLDKRDTGLLRLFYISTNAKLSAAVQKNLWTENAFNLLLNKTGLAVAQTIQDASAVSRFSDGLTIAYSSFKKECVAYEDFGREQLRIKTESSVWNQRPVGGWYEAGTNTPCGCGG